MTENGFSILNICLVKLWDKTGILHPMANSQIFQALEIPRGWRGKKGLITPKCCSPVLYFSFPSASLLKNTLYAAIVGGPSPGLP